MKRRAPRSACRTGRTAVPGDEWHIRNCRRCDAFPPSRLRMCARRHCHRSHILPQPDLLICRAVRRSKQRGCKRHALQISGVVSASVTGRGNLSQSSSICAVGTRIARPSRREAGSMLGWRNIAHYATFVALLDCRYDDRPPAVAPVEPANPAEAPEPRMPAPDLPPPQRSEVDLNPGPGTGPVASTLAVGGFGGEAGAGGVGGTAGLSGSGGVAATSPQPIR
jgi:hypothetical protein